MPSLAKQIFDQALVDVQAIEGLHVAVSSMTTTALDPSDMLRAGIVLVASAIDTYAHRIALIGIVAQFQGHLPKKNVRIPINIVGSATSTISTSQFENEIRSQLSYQTFQQPDKYAEALRHAGVEDLWQKLGLSMGVAASDAKRQLALVIDRRNKIAHESDLDRSTPPQKWPISLQDLQSARHNVDRIVMETDLLLPASIAF